MPAARTPATTAPTTRAEHVRWLEELTVIPTAAGREGRVIAWVEAWVARRRNLRLRRDEAGNLIITRTGARRGKPIFLQAHLDHPAFVVRAASRDRDVELEFRGGVHDPYFADAVIEIFDAETAPRRARIVELQADRKPFKRVRARLTRSGPPVAKGAIGRWAFRGDLPRIERGLFHTHACDDLAAVAAALATLDTLGSRGDAGNVGVLLTRAEEIGFVGTLAACRDGSIPRDSRLICLENSRSFAESPIGAGPILRVGDRLSVFSPELTNRLGAVLTRHAKKRPGFTWQRKLMPGGACEATAFSAFGYESTCICLPLGNYHNMGDIDGVAKGKRPARVRPECISLDDYHGMIEMLSVCVTQMDADDANPIRADLARRLETLEYVLGEETG